MIMNKNNNILSYDTREDVKEFFVKFSRECDVEVLSTSKSPEMATADLAKGCKCISVVTKEINAELIQKFYDVGVRFISTRTAGYDHIDVEAARKLGMQVDNISYSPSSVSEYTVMLILMLIRKLKIILERTSVQDNSLSAFQGRELHTMTIGVIGTGAIGCRVIQNLSGFGCRILAYNRREIEAVKPYCKYVPLEKLYEQSDLITLHIPASQENFHFVGKTAISKMKTGVFLVNNSRESLIDTEALIEGIEQKKIGGAALDVISGENAHIYRDMKGEIIQNREYAVLKSFPNVIITPHTAFYTDQAISDMVENSVRSCAEFMKEIA